MNNTDLLFISVHLVFGIIVFLAILLTEFVLGEKKE